MGCQTQNFEKCVKGAGKMKADANKRHDEWGITHHDGMVGL